jgi:hypothetical protein
VVMRILKCPQQRVESLRQSNYPASSQHRSRRE